MIQLIHEITIKMLQNKTTPTTLDDTPVSATTSTAATDPITPTVTNTSSSPAQEVVEATPSSATSPVSQPGPSALKPIDLSELKSRLQNAYRTPSADVAVS